MLLTNKRQLKSSLHTEWRRIALLGCMFLVFVSNALGIIQFGSDLWPGINFSTNYLKDVTGTFTLPAIVKSSEFLLLLGSGALLIVLLPLLSPIPASFLVLAMAIPPVFMAINNPYRPSSIPMQFNLLVLLVLFGTNVLMKYLAIARERQKLLDVFSQYLPQQIVRELSDKSKEIALEGEARVITVMFCDLRNFTSMSENLKPSDVVKLLNAYFTAMTDVLFKYGATIDKYIGDSIMAFWGAPVPQQDHALRAVQASFEMHMEIQRIAPLFHSLNLPTPTIGIGINTGMVNVGNMGSHHRLAYTAIGDAVNLAFRLQSATRDYLTNTIVGEETAMQLPAMILRELDRVTFRGKTKITRIFEPLCSMENASPELLQQLSRHNEALQLWYNHETEQSLAMMQSLSSDHPEINYYQSMVLRISSSK